MVNNGSFYSVLVLSLTMIKQNGVDIWLLQDLCFNPTTTIREPASVDETYFIHCCCEDGSLLLNPVGGTRLKIVDVTTETDFTDQSTVNDVIGKLVYWKEAPFHIQRPPHFSWIPQCQ